MNRNPAEPDNALLRRVRHALDAGTVLSPLEKERLRRARREAFAQQPGRAAWRRPAFVAIAAGFAALAALVVLLHRDGIEPLPLQLAETDDPVLLFRLAEYGVLVDPGFAAWALEDSH